jgi:glycosyltransferase involved in cell wall biosynthesis
MRIAMIGQKGMPAVTGGIERHVDELARRLGRHGHEVLVYTRTWFAPACRDLAPGVSTIAAPTIKTKHLDAIVHTFTSSLAAIRAGVDVIHYHGVGPALLAWIPRLLAPRIKVVTTFHCIDRNHAKWGRLAQWALHTGEWAACKFPHATITVSQLLQKYAAEQYQTEATYIPNGVTKPAKGIGSDQLAQFGLQPNKYLVMVSRLVRHKGAHLLIMTYRQLKQAGLHNGHKLAIVGGSSFTDEYVAELKALAGGDPDIVFTDTQTGAALEQLYANAYMMVHPSSSEGLPICVLEGMAYGQAVLASDIPEITEVTAEHGFSFRDKNVFDLYSKLAELIADPYAVVQKGRAARQFVLEGYAWDDIAVKVSGLYTELCPQPGVVVGGPAEAASDAATVAPAARSAAEEENIKSPLPA